MSLSLGFDCLSARLPVTNGKRQIVAPFNIATERANGQPRRLGTNYVGRAAIALAGTSGRSILPVNPAFTCAARRASFLTLACSEQHFYSIIIV